MKPKLPAAILLWFFSSLLTAADEAPTAILPKGLKSCGEGIVERVLTGDRFQLATGETIRLAETKAPEYWPDGAPYKTWPYGYQAKRALEDLITGQPVRLRCKSKRQDHLGDTVAHALGADGAWVQHSLIAAGHAYFMPYFSRPVAEAPLRSAEAFAQTAELGLWQRRLLAPVTATGDAVRPGWFQLVEGKILSENRRHEKTYLNFGRDWRRDFTVEIPKKLYRQFDGTSDATLGLTGKTIQVRGWVEWAGGPKIILEDAAQLLVLEAE